MRGLPIEDFRFSIEKAETQRTKFDKILCGHEFRISSFEIRLRAIGNQQSTIDN